MPIVKPSLKAITYKPVDSIINVKHVENILTLLDLDTICKIINEPVKKVSKGMYIIKRKQALPRPHDLHVLLDHCMIKLYMTYALGFDTYSLRGLLYLARGKLIHKLYYREYLIKNLKKRNVKAEVQVEGYLGNQYAKGIIDFLVLNSDYLDVIELKSSKNVGKGTYAQALAYKEILDIDDARVLVIYRSNVKEIQDEKYLHEALSLYYKVINSSEPPINLQLNIKPNPSCPLCGFKKLCIYYEEYIMKKKDRYDIDVLKRRASK